MERSLKQIHILSLLGLLTALLLVCLGMQVKSLPVAYEQYQEEAKQLALLNRSDLVLEELHQQAEQLDSKINKYAPRKIELSSHLDFVKYLEEGSREQNTRIIALPRGEKTAAEGFQLITESFSLEADLHSLLAFLHELEWEDRIGSIVSLNLQKRVIRRGNTRRPILVAEVELQRIIES